MINVKYFGSRLLKIEEKSYKDTDIYYMGYIIIESIGFYENIHRVNPLYFIVDKVDIT